MKEIKLTQNQIALVDDDDFEELSRYNWSVIGGYNTYYAIRWPNITMHHHIMRADYGVMFDHIDKNGLNNQKLNLRRCTNSQNQVNTNKRPGYSSKYKGVMWHKGRRKWIATITKNRHQIYLGQFTMEDAAAMVYNQKAIELFGEFARLNKIGE